MKAALIFTGSGPILVLTNFESLQSPEFVQRLAVRGVSKFIAREVPLDLVRKRYGTRFSVVVGDLSQKDDLRVMDIDGHHVFKNFSFEELGTPVYSPPLREAAKETVMEKRIESEVLWTKFDEYGTVVESSYLPMVGSRITPSVPMKQGHFKINGEGIIVEGSPESLNGRKLVLHGKATPALGRTDTVTPACTWRPDDKGGWICT